MASVEIIPPEGATLDVSLEEIQNNKVLHATLNQWFERCANQRLPFEQQWYMNMAFYFGKQWVSWVGNMGNPGTLRLQEPPAPNWRVRLTCNKVRPIIRNELTKLTKEEPQPFVVPNTMDESDLVAARAAEATAEYLMDETKFNRHRRSSTFWSLLTGTGFIKVIWDSNKKDKSGKYTGTIDVSVPTTFHIFVPNLQEEDIENQPYVIHAITMSADDVEARWGVRLEADSEVGGGIFEQKLLNVLGINRNQQPQKMVLVKECWVKPCAKYPEGLTAFYTKDTLLEVNQGWPYEHGMYPIRKIVHVPSTKFYGDSVIVDLIPLQREYNRNRSSVIESKNRMAKPQLMAQKGSIDPSKMTSEPGAIIFYNMGFQPPQPLPLQPLPQYVLQIDDRTLADMDDASGQYEVTKGRTPPGVEAASAIAYLQEENDSRLHHTVASIEEMVSDVGRMMLSLAGQFWTEERMVRVVGKTNTFEARMFKGSDLSGNYDYRVESSSMAPRSKAAKQAFITDLMKNGIITPEMGLKYLQMNETNALFNELQVDIRQAQRENVAMSQLELPKPDPMAMISQQMMGAMPQPQIDEMGQPVETDPMLDQPAFMTVPTNPFDNHAIHEREHARYMKTQEFELLEEHQKAAILQHWQEHRMKLQELAVAAQQTGVPGEQVPDPQETASQTEEQQAA